MCACCPVVHRCNSFSKRTFVLVLSDLLSLFCLVSHEPKNLIVCAVALLRFISLSLLMLSSCPLALISCLVPEQSWLCVQLCQPCPLTSDQIHACAPVLICDQQTGRRAGSRARVYFPFPTFQYKNICTVGQDAWCDFSQRVTKIYIIPSLLQSVPLCSCLCIYVGLQAHSPARIPVFSVCPACPLCP